MSYLTLQVGSNYLPLSVGATGASFVDHPRLLLTAGKLADLTAKRTANTAEYAAVKTYVDTYTPAAASLETTLTAELGTGGSGTTFTVADGSAFPSGQSQVQIDLEILTVTRSGNTFTVVSRGNDWGDGSGGTATSSHPSGASVWSFTTSGTDLVGATPSLALLIAIGETGYNTKARWSLANYLAYYSRSSVYTSDNTIRWNGWGLALSYDWLHAVLTVREKAVYAELFRIVIQDQLDVPKLADTGPQAFREAAAGNNVANGQIRSALAMAAATYGDQADALTQWNALVNKVDDSIRPAMLGGGISAGPLVEGSEYCQTSWVQLIDVFRVLASALDNPALLEAIEPWVERLVEHVLYATSPGATGSTTTTTGTIAAGSTALTVASTTSFAVGQEVLLTLDGGGGTNLTVDSVTNTDVAPDGVTVSAADVGKIFNITGNGSTWGPQGITQKVRVDSIVSGKWRLSRSPAPADTSGGVWTLPSSYHTTIAAISGTAVTLANPVPNSATSKTLAHWPALFTFGDVEGIQNYQRYPTTGSGGDLLLALSAAQDVLGSSHNSSRYVEHWFSNASVLPVVSSIRWLWFFSRQTSVSALDYTASLPVNYSTTDPDAFGLLLGRSAWASDASWATLIAGHHVFDHSTSYFGSFGYQRKGVPLTWHLVAYFGQGTRGPYYNVPAGSGFMELPYLGSRWHNAILMNGHSAMNPGVGNTVNVNPARLDRSAVASTYLYGRVDASGPYTAVNWTTLGYANNDAQTWIRDFLYLNPDLIVVHDRTVYANATTSPTTWFLNTPGEPVLASQRLTMTQSGQKLVTDVLLPGTATITVVDLVADEDEALEGFRTEWVSGTSASTEYGLQILQGMDAGDSPATVTSLTTTNANVVQVGSTHVVGFVKGATPTLPISYDYTGTPAHYLMGFASSTAYHLVDSAGTVTISTATGTGDTTSNAAGMLIF